MAFVYRYLANRIQEDIVKYVGIVKGDTLQCLQRRITQHASDPRFCKSWKIEYIDGITQTDAEALEGHFIALNRKTCINIAKRDWGELSLKIENPPNWKPYIETEINNEISKFRRRNVAPRQEPESFVCSFCRREIKGYPGNYIEINCGGCFEKYLCMWLCGDCQERLSKSFFDYFSPFATERLFYKPQGVPADCDEKYIEMTAFPGENDRGFLGRKDKYWSCWVKTAPGVEVLTPIHELLSEEA